MSKEMTERKFQQGVNLAKRYFTDRNVMRFKVAEVALEYCEIHKGGNFSRFSVARFARELGLKKSTLHDWIQIKLQVVDKLHVKVREQAHEIQYNLLKRCHQQVAPDMKPAQVQKIFKEVAGINPIILRMQKYGQHMNGLLHNVKDPMKLIDVSEQQLVDLKSKAQLIANLIQKELEFREKHGEPQKVDRREKIERDVAKAKGDVSRLFKYGGT